MSDLERLPTPALVLDRPRLEANLGAMARRMVAHGVALRPHLKTAKCVEVARLALAHGATGVTVSTLREAEYLAAGGIVDATYAVGVVPGRLERAAALIRGGASLRLLTDDAGGVAAIGDAATRFDVRFDVLIEIDCGGSRAGLDPEGPELLQLAERLAATRGTRLAGVLTHAGQSYGCRSRAEIEQVAEDERRHVVRAAERLRDAGFPCSVVSAGSTPTAICARDLTGVNEMRPGVYMFFDLYQLGLGVCSRDDLALSVLSTVIGHNPRAGHLLIDAGALALSKDAGAERLRPGVGYGEVCDPESLEPLGLTVASVHQEHGMLAATTADFNRHPVGSRLRILPGHACLTAAAHSHYAVVEGRRVVDRWERANRW